MPLPLKWLRTFDERTGACEASPGAPIDRAAREAIASIKLAGLGAATLKFNDVEIDIVAESCFGDICEIYQLKCELQRYRERFGRI